LVFLLAGGLLLLTTLGYAGPREEYVEADKIHLSAGASVAAYQSRIGEIASRYLSQAGWRVDHYVQPSGRSGARFLVATRRPELGDPMYVVAIVGTENSKDVKVDLKTSKAGFTGPESPEKVHQGFKEFIQAGPAAVARSSGNPLPNLPELLKMNPQAKLILTGHSLGGAAATLAGAYLIEQGIKPNQIEVISFGAPAVGNAAFAEKYSSVLNLTRVVIAGDPVVTALQGLVGGYRQFGREIKFKIPETLEDPHNIVGYLDVAMKNHYDKKQAALVVGEAPLVQAVDRAADLGKVCIAPLQNKLPMSLTGEYAYMREALLEEYQQTLPDALFIQAESTSDLLSAATAQECRWLVAPRVEGVSVRQEKKVYYITNQQIVYEVQTGTAVDVADFSTGTYNLTPLEAFAHGFKGIAAHRSNWLK
jgi:hypothetical protein